jgi:hypothetical protein
MKTIASILIVILVLTTIPSASAQTQTTTPAVPQTQGAPQVQAAAPPDSLLIEQGRMVSAYFLDAVSSANATVGMPVRLALKDDFIMNDLVVLPHDKVIHGTVTKVRRAIAGEKRAKLEIAFADLPLGGSATLKIQETETEASGERAGHILLWIAASPLIALVSPLFLAFLISDHLDEGKPTGEEINRHACSNSMVWVSKDTMVDVAALSTTNDQVTPEESAAIETCKISEPGLKNRRHAQIVDPTASAISSTPALSAPASTPEVKPALPSESARPQGDEPAPAPMPSPEGESASLPAHL